MDTKYTYDARPYNAQDQDKHMINRGGLVPAYKYKQPRVIWLNSAYRTSDISSGNTFYEISWDINQFQLYNLTKLKVLSYISNEASAKPIIIKIKDVLYDAQSTYNSDREGFATLYVNHTGVASQHYNDYLSMVLMPQQISRITLTLNNSFNAKNSGFTINTGTGAGHFVIGLMFEDLDLVADNTISPYL